ADPRAAPASALSPNGFDRTLGGIVINSDAPPTQVGRQIGTAVGDRLAPLLIGQVVNAHGLRAPFRTPFPPVVLEVSDPLFLFGGSRNDGRVSSLTGRPSAARCSTWASRSGS